jgi:ribosomal-protein-alanine N-acetyltransferase
MVEAVRVHTMSIQFRRTVSILRIFDIAKAKAFYLDFLGFKSGLEASLRAGVAALYADFTR